MWRAESLEFRRQGCMGMVGLQVAGFTVSTPIAPHPKSPTLTLLFTTRVWGLQFKLLGIGFWVFRGVGFRVSGVLGFVESWVPLLHPPAAPSLAFINPRFTPKTISNGNQRAGR